MTWNQLGYHAKPCGLLDVKWDYACLADHMNCMVDQSFLVPAHRRMILTSGDPADLIDQFMTYDPPKVEKWIEKKMNYDRFFLQVA